MSSTKQSAVANVRRAPQEVQNSKDLIEAFRLMRAGDPPLPWDSTSMYYDVKNLYEIARGLGWRVGIKCDPSMKHNYVPACEGRLMITRYL